LKSNVGYTQGVATPKKGGGGEWTDPWGAILQKKRRGGQKRGGRELK